MRQLTFTAHIEKDHTEGIYVGIIPGVRGAHTQAESLDQLHKNLEEVLLLCLEEMDEEQINNLPEFVGVQQLSVSL